MKPTSERLERFDFDGSIQWALVRGDDVSKPVLLVVQAGPGFPLIHEAPALQKELDWESQFRVVYWDQRGTGKSASLREKGAIPLETLVDDVRRMVRTLCQRLAVRELAIVGFSLGATLALMASEDATLQVSSLVAVGPDVDMLASEHFALEFARTAATAKNNRRALRDLKRLPEPPHTDPRDFGTRVQWVSNFGGIARNKTFAALLKENVWRLLRSPHYSFREAFRALRAISATQARVLPSLVGLSLLTDRCRPQLPTTIFQGRYDAAAPPHLAEALSQQIGARLIWFDESAHAPQFEEPRKFRDELLKALHPCQSIRNE